MCRPASCSPTATRTCLQRPGGSPSCWCWPARRRTNGVIKARPQLGSSLAQGRSERDRRGRSLREPLPPASARPSAVRLLLLPAAKSPWSCSARGCYRRRRPPASCRRYGCRTSVDPSLSPSVGEQLFAATAALSFDRRSTVRRGVQAVDGVPQRTATGTQSH
jgi:hypothetical protein